MAHETLHTLLLFTALLQALVGLGLGGLFWHQSRATAKPMLRHLSLGFFAGGLAVVLSTTAAYVGVIYPSIFLLSLAIEFIARVLGFVSIGFIALGTFALIANQRLPSYLTRGVIAAAASLGFASTTLWLWSALRDGGPPLGTADLSAIVALAAYSAVVLALMARWPERRPNFGRALTTLAFTGFALLAAFEFVLSLPFAALTPLSTSALPWVGLVEVFVVLAIGGGLVVWIGERDRERADLAAHELEQLRSFDPVTGLPTRERLILDGTRALAARPGARFAMTLIEIARVRDWRDTLGRRVHALALAEFAARLKSVREVEVLGQLGEERFALLLGPLEGTTEVGAVVEALLRRLSDPIRVDDQTIYPVVAIGIALCPLDADDIDTLIVAAASAMRRAAGESGRQARFFSPKSDLRERERLALAADLRHALDHPEFQLHFQPVLDVASGDFGYLEALLRWHRPGFGLTLPAYFLDTLEEAQLMPQLDRIVIELACRDIAERRAGGRLWLPVAINLSAQGFQSPDCPTWIAEAMARHGIPPRALEVEITESAAISNLGQARTTLARLRDLGVGVILDDFGIGHSSLAQLRDLAVTRIKIDRSFTSDVVTNPKSAAIVRAIIGLGRDLGIEVVAEGVETAAQFDHYRLAGVRFVQGFEISYPLASNLLDAALAKAWRHAATA